MTIAEIYQQILFNVFGDTPSVPANIFTYLRGSEGRIAKIHRKLQIDADYWFMRDSYRYSINGEVEKSGTYVQGNNIITLSNVNDIQVGMAVVSEDFEEETFVDAIDNVANTVTVSKNPKVDGTAKEIMFYVRRFPLPSDFKKENVVSQRLYNTGIQIKRVAASEITATYNWRAITSTPMYYWIYNNHIWFDGNIISKCDIVIDYYKYLQYNDADDYEDELTIRASDVIIHYCAFNVASLLQDYSKSKYFGELYSESLMMFRRENLMRESAFDNYDVRLV